ncbi:MAG: hypothetical protein HYT98_04240 [Candidatus Sungbacteria bacterium]|nr:hypothetical protein [Candidatus Sungbacteria bacterium]
MIKPGFLDHHRVLNSLQACFLMLAFLTVAAGVSAGPGPGPGIIDYRVEGLATAGPVPGPITAGQLVTFSATVRNYGDDAETIPSQTRLRLDINNDNPPGVWDLTISPDQTTAGLTSFMSPGDNEVETWSNAWTAQVGTHLFEVCADVELVIAETNEGNNCTTQTFTVSANTDLTSALNSPGTLNPGPVTFSGNITNIGAGANISSFNNLFYIDFNNNSPDPIGLAGGWHFDETSGTSAGDFSGSGINGTLVNMESTDWMGGRVNGALDFDGVNEYVNLGTNLNTVRKKAAVTISAWVRRESVVAGFVNGVVSFSINSAVPTNESRAALEFTSSGNVRVVGRSMDTEAIQSVSTSGAIPPLALNTWYHIAGVINYAGDFMSVYVNGALAASGPVNFSQSLTPNTPSSYSAIGSQDDGSGVYFDGQIDEVYVYGRALNASEIAQLYNDTMGKDRALTPHPMIAAGALAPSGSQSVTSGTWTAELGTHRISLCADQPNPVENETNETNNCSAQTFTVSTASEPDYITEGLATAGPVPGPISAGQLVTFAATVRNSGTGAASVSSQTRLRLDIDNNGTWDFTPADQTTGALAAASNPGDTEVENWTNAWTAQVGTHLFEVCADVGNAFSETSDYINDTSQGNNCTTATFNVGVPPTPDLVVGPSITVNGTLIAGQTLTFTNSGVTNVGTANAGASTARFCIDNSNCLTSSTGQINAPSIGALTSGGGSSGSITSSSWPATIGPHTVYFCADVSPVPPPGAVTESNENNNCAGAGTSFTVGAAFDFSLSNNGNVSVTQGYNTSRTINASLDSGATQSVTFSITSAPISGVSFSFAPSPASCNPPCSKTLNITTSGSTPAGSYPVTVTGTSGPLTRTTTFTLTVNAQTLLISSLSVVPNPADPGVNRNITATRDPASTALGTINYSFWWNCNNAGTNVGTVSGVCGALPPTCISPGNPVGCEQAGDGICATNSNGAKCNGESATSMMVPRAYALRSTAKVILEQGPAPSAERRTVVNVNLDATCTAVPAIASMIDDTVRWTAFPTGGSGSYSFIWSGDAPLGGQTANPYDAIYPSSGQKNGAVTVSDGFTSDGPNTCTNSPIEIKGRIVTFGVDPTPIDAGKPTTVSWTTDGFGATDCTLTDNNPKTAINNTPVQTNCGIAGYQACPKVNLASTTIFTLTCDGISRSATALVKPPPSFIEIPPQ